MFTDEIHKEAMKKFMAYLRTVMSQSKLSFFSDVSREHIRCIEKGKKNPSVKIFINMISAAGLDVKEALGVYADMLSEEYENLMKTDKAGLAYVFKTKKTGGAKGSGTKNKAAKVQNLSKKIPPTKKNAKN